MLICYNNVVSLGHNNTSSMPRQARKTNGTGVYHDRSENRSLIYRDNLRLYSKARSENRPLIYLGKTTSGQTIYTSARDVGNIAAGAVAAKNGIPWKAARAAFDDYQGGREGVSTQKAEYYGWSQVYSRSNGVTESIHLRKTINNYMKKAWTAIRKLW